MLSDTPSPWQGWLAAECPPASGPPPVSGRIRVQPEDFQVFEQLGFEPGADGISEGNGEHLWLHIRKRNFNSMDVLELLAKQARLPLRAVGISGLKDRVAVTEQWFSLHLPGKADPAFDLPDGVEILKAIRHSRKLNRGTHRSNRFCLRVRELEGDLAALEQRCQQVAKQGVPNYFGVQRFGREARNLANAVSWLTGDGEAPRKRTSRSMWISALRSEAFNRVLAARVQQGNWDSLLAGDILQPEGSRGLFRAVDDDTSSERLARGEVHPTGPLPGLKPMLPDGDCLALETAAMVALEAALAGLDREVGVDAARRALRLPVNDMHWQIDPVAAELTLGFSLPSGAFATSVLAELVQLKDDKQPPRTTDPRTIDKEA